MRLTCNGFVWAGGQEKAPGSLVATFKRNGTTIEWDAVVEMQRPIKTVTTIIRDVPRGQHLTRRRPAVRPASDNETLGGYTFGAGDLHGPGAATGSRPRCAVVQASDQDFVLRLVARRRACVPSGSTSSRASAAIASRRSTSTTHGATTRA